MDLLEVELIYLAMKNTSTVIPLLFVTVVVGPAAAFWSCIKGLVAKRSRRVPEREERRGGGIGGRGEVVAPSKQRGALLKCEPAAVPDA
jgi:hypothetical protein